MRLNRKNPELFQNIPVNITVGPLNNMPEKVLQFGEGNFLRAFVDWHFNELNKKGLFNGKIIIVQPLKEGLVNILNEQDGLYTLLLRGLKNGEEVEKTEIITSVGRGINPYTEWEEYLKCAQNPELRYIVSNTTEAGISYVKTPWPEDECPASFPAKVTALLYERFKYFGGAGDKGMVIIPCELIENNGDKLRECILKHSTDWELGDQFISWLRKSNYFFNTLVDRIVPGYPRDEIGTISKKLNYEDKILVSSEIFHLWVIQGNEKVNSELPFREAGLNVIWTDDLTPYRSLKVRILNGTHTMITIPSYLAGKRTVKECLEDESIGEFLKEGLFNEILPTVEASGQKKIEFANSVIERFLNPFIKHYLESITLNSISKYRVRLLQSLLKYYEMYNEFPPVLTFSLAALIVFYCGYSGNEGKDNGKWKDEIYTIRDDEQTLEFFYELKRKYDENPEELISKTLENKLLWGRNLNEIHGLADCISNYYVSIHKMGMKSAIEELSNSQLTH